MDIEKLLVELVGDGRVNKKNKSIVFALLMRREEINNLWIKYIYAEFNYQMIGVQHGEERREAYDRLCVDRSNLYKEIEAAIEEAVNVYKAMDK